MAAAMAGAGSAREHVRAVGRAIRPQAAALAADWRGRDAAAWEAPTACTGWTVRDVAAHLSEGANRAVPVVRAALEGAPVPQLSAEERAARTRAMRQRPGGALAAQLPHGVEAVFTLLEGADEAGLGITVVVPAGPHTLANFATQRLVEAALHAWDIRAPADPSAAVPADAAAPMVDYLLGRVPRLANPEGAVAGTYRCELEGPGGGPVVLAIHDGAATGSRDDSTAADVTLALPVEAWVRLVWGRLDLGRAVAAGTVRATGDRERVLALGTVFRGH